MDDVANELRRMADYAEKNSPAISSTSVMLLRAGADELDRRGDALMAIADDGLLMHGPEGMDEVQKKVWDVVQTLPEYRRREREHSHSAEGSEK